MGAVIRQARRAAARTQAELGESLRMSRATISAIENGTIREIGVRKLMALCEALALELSVAPKNRRPTLQELRQERSGARRGA